jgi:hypothetical protein
VRRLVPLGLAAAALALAASACGGADPHVQAAKAATKPGCAYPAGWQKLANRIGAPVYCPTWLPDPLKGQIGGRWNNVDSVSKDRSYLESFVWQDTDGPNVSGELHVNLRGYPGRTTIPTCHDVLFGGGKPKNITVPCFADPHGPRTINGIRFTEYTVNQDADQWHLLYAWRYRGGLYTVSEHVAPPLTFTKVRQYLDRITRGLVLVRPAG